jgi:surface protein
MTDGVVNLSGWDLSNCTTISYFFYNTYLKHVDLSNWKFGKNVSLVGAFTVMGNLDGPFDLSSWKGTEYITDLGNAFNGCYVPINLNGWDTTNVRSFWATFIDCKEFTKEDINTCNATRMDSMFEKYAGDYVDCSDWENPKNTTLESMFYFANVKSVNMQNFKTSKVTTMKYMFVGCYYLMSLDLSSFDTSNVTNMYGMFCYDRSLESLDLSNFDITNVTDYNLMFYGCSSLKYIKC